MRSPGPIVKAAQQIRVDGMTAEYLIGFRSLLDAFAVCSDAQAMAEFLHVDADLIYARMLQLSDLEKTMLQVCGIRCIGIELSAPHPDGPLVA